MANILDYIPFGHENAVSRDFLSNIYMSEYGLEKDTADRKMRRDIEKASTREHPILNLQDQKGYFQPLPEEIHLVKLYRAQENRRTLTIRKKVSEIDKYIKAAGNEVERNQMSLSDLPGWNGR